MAKANVTFCHPNSDGSGSALRAEMHYQNEERPGFIRMRIAPQDGDGFDFDKAISFDLGVADLSKLMLVLRDEAEEMDGGNPLALGDTKFAAKRLDKNGGYALAASKKTESERRELFIVLKRYEALGLLSSFDGAMFFLSFVKGVTP